MIVKISKKELVMLMTPPNNLLGILQHNEVYLIDKNLVRLLLYGIKKDQYLLALKAISSSFKMTVISEVMDDTADTNNTNTDNRYICNEFNSNNTICEYINYLFNCAELFACN